MIFNNYNNKNNGFTLMETVIATSILVIGVIGTFALITFTTSVSSLGSQKLVATYLAQEGIEIIRNIRDTNWLQESAAVWDEGLTTNCLGDVDNCTTTTGCIVDYNDSLGPTPLLPVYTGQFLFLDGNALYNRAGTGSQTKFQRKIVIETEGSYILRVCSLVQWQAKGVSNTVSVKENLYNWLQ